MKLPLFFKFLLFIICMCSWTFYIKNKGDHFGFVVIHRLLLYNNICQFDSTDLNRQSSPQQQNLRMACLFDGRLPEICGSSILTREAAH